MSVNGTFIVDGSMSKLIVAIYDINHKEIPLNPPISTPVITDDQGVNYTAHDRVQNIYYYFVPIDSTQKNSVMLMKIRIDRTTNFLAFRN